jgi:hypothetical protein
MAKRSSAWRVRDDHRNSRAQKEERGEAWYRANTPKRLSDDEFHAQARTLCDRLSRVGKLSPDAGVQQQDLRVIFSLSQLLLNDNRFAKAAKRLEKELESLGSIFDRLAAQYEDRAERFREVVLRNPAGAESAEARHVYLQELCPNAAHIVTIDAIMARIGPDLPRRGLNAARMSELRASTEDISRHYPRDNNPTILKQAWITPVIALPAKLRLHDGGSSPHAIRGPGAGHWQELPIAAQRYN